jgi:hypothetical protein
MTNDRASSRSLSNKTVFAYGNSHGSDANEANDEP